MAQVEGRTEEDRHAVGAPGAPRDPGEVAGPGGPPTAQLAGLGLLTVGITVALTAIPARWEARRPIAEILRGD